MRDPLSAKFPDLGLLYLLVVHFNVEFDHVIFYPRFCSKFSRQMLKGHLTPKVGQDIYWPGWATILAVGRGATGQDPRGRSGAPPFTHRVTRDGSQQHPGGLRHG